MVLTYLPPKQETHCFKSSFKFLAPKFCDILNEDIKNASNLFRFKRDFDVKFSDGCNLFVFLY